MDMQSRQARQVRQVDAERFEVVEPEGPLVVVALRRDTREGLGLRSVAPSAVVTEAVAMLADDGRWPPPMTAQDVDVIGLLARAPSTLDDLRARLID
jgi:hypothetical protein